MPHYLAIDYGEKRIGLAYGDELGVATPIKAAVDSSLEKRLQTIASAIKERAIDQLVVGYPLNMNGSKGKRVEQVEIFIKKLEDQFLLPVHRVDERLSSHQVEMAFKGTKKKWDRKSGDLDSRAASVFLQEFLDQKIEFQILEDEDMIPDNYC